MPVSFFSALAYATMFTPPRTSRYPHIALDVGSVRSHRFVTCQLARRI